MLFSDLLQRLQKGDSKVKEYNTFCNPDIRSAQSIDKAKIHQITFLDNDSYLAKEYFKTEASCVLIPDHKDIKQELNRRSIAWISMRYPKIAFAETLEILNPPFNYKAQIHTSAILEENVDLGNDLYIGPNVYIAENCIIGSNCIIHPGVIIYNNVEIAPNTTLHANCVIHPYSCIGRNCIIHSNVVIGSEGFGFIPSENGWRKMPQTGKVIIENNVEIGACTTVDRPSVGETIVGEGTKIDNLVQIGHGVKIGRNCAMASQVGIAGGANIDDGVILAGQVGVGNRVNIGKGVVASSKCGVHANVEPGQVISGFPAMPNKLWLRCSANFKKLPQLAKAIRDLAKQDEC